MAWIQPHLSKGSTGKWALGASASVSCMSFTSKGPSKQTQPTLPWFLDLPHTLFPPPSFSYLTYWSLPPNHLFPLNPAMQTPGIPPPPAASAEGSKGGGVNMCPLSLPGQACGLWSWSFILTPPCVSRGVLGRLFNSLGPGDNDHTEGGSELWQGYKVLGIAPGSE